MDLEKTTRVQPQTHGEPQQSNQLKKQPMFSHPFSFKGRIRRLELGLSYLIYLIYGVIISFVMESLSDYSYDPTGFNAIVRLGLFLLWVVAYVFLIAQRCKRCHDRGNSGWFQLIPFYGLWLLFADGDTFDNGYGPDPKGRNTWPV